MRAEPLLRAGTGTTAIGIQLYDLPLEHWWKNKGKGRTTTHPIDTWFREIMASIAHQANAASERLKFRTSTRLLFFELPQYFKWYIQRAGA